MGILSRHGRMLGFGALVMLASCEKKPAPAPAESGRSAPSAAPKASAPSPPKAVERDEALDASVAAGDAGTFKLGELEDVGPAGPSSASSKGIVMLTRDDQLLLVPLPQKGALEPVKQDAGAFAPYARGPSIAGDFAYWVSKGRVVRQKLTGGPLEVLAEGAQDGLRVSALSGKDGRPTGVAFIGRPPKPDGDPVAMIWVEGGDIQRLSPEGSAASTVALGSIGKDLLAVFLEGRTGMTPVHARRMRFPDGKPKLDEDVVMWIAGPAQPTTEVVTGSSDAAESWAFVPLERDTSRFGLAEMRIGETPKMEIPVTWRAYPNGMSPAPVSAADACGGTLIAYVRPSDAKPGAPQELHLAKLEAEGLGPSQVVAHSRMFTNVSVAAFGDGVLVTYVGDHRTWATRVACAAHH